MSGGGGGAKSPLMENHCYEGKWVLKDSSREHTMELGKGDGAW